MIEADLRQNSIKEDTMEKGKSNRACWFRMFLNLKPMIDAVPEASAGAALKAAFAYFDTGEAPSGLDLLANALFLAIKPAIDESVSDYQKAVINGRRGGKRRWSREAEDSPPIPPLSHPIGVVTEKETEKEIEIEIDIDIEKDVLAEVCQENTIPPSSEPPARYRYC